VSIKWGSTLPLNSKSKPEKISQRMYQHYFEITRSLIHLPLIPIRGGPAQFSRQETCKSHGSLELCIEDAQLDTISRNNLRDQNDCKRNMFRKWLTNFPEALYKQLVQVLVELDEKK